MERRAGRFHIQRPREAPVTRRDLALEMRLRHPRVPDPDEGTIVATVGRSEVVDREALLAGEGALAGGIEPEGPQLAIGVGLYRSQRPLPVEAWFRVANQTSMNPRVVRSQRMRFSVPVEVKTDTAPTLAFGGQREQIPRAVLPRPPLPGDARHP